MTAAQTFDMSAYRVLVTNEATAWPEAGRMLVDELVRTGNVGLITGPGGAVEGTLARLRNDLGLSCVSIGETLSRRQDAPAIGDIDSILGDAVILTDIDLLFAPPLHINVLALLGRRGRRCATIAVWPGVISGRRAVYSIAGRGDHQDVALANALVLRPIPTRFPDEVPFEIERISR